MSPRLLLVVCLLVPMLAPAASEPYALSASTFLGSELETDAVRGLRIQSDGVIVLAANIGIATPGGTTPRLLNNTTSSSGGAVLRLSPDGRSVLSVSRIAASVFDLAVDESDRIVVAAGTDGVVKLNPSGSAIQWVRLRGKFMYRVDVGTDGRVVAHRPSNLADPDATAGEGRTYLFTGKGVRISDFPGYRNTTDLCIDSNSKTIIQVGWRQASAFDGNSSQPVQIAFLRGVDYRGRLKWLNYDWSSESGNSRFLNRFENNMADTRGNRCSMGRDGKLYAAFECAGGNHIFRWNPRDLSRSAPIVGGDLWHNFSNTSAEHKSFAGRYAPSTGRLLLAQQFVNRLSDGRGNTIRVQKGEIRADEGGRMYLGGASASGLPIPFAPFFSEKPGQIAFNPFGAQDYTGGAWFVVMSPDLNSRLFTTRLTTGGETHTLDARKVNGAVRVAWAGATGSPLFTVRPIQPNSAGGTDGFVSVLRRMAETD